MTATTELNFATVAGVEVATDHWIGGERVGERRPLRRDLADRRLGDRPR